MVCSQSAVCILYCPNITSFSSGANFKHAHPIFSGIFQAFLEGWVYMCVCVEELGERRRARGINKRLRVVWKQGKLACAVCLKPRASKLSINQQLYLSVQSSSLPSGLLIGDSRTKLLQFKPALRFLGLFAVDFLIRKHP